MEITISVPSKLEGILAEKAAAKGQDVKDFIEDLVERQVGRPSLDEILAPIRDDFVQSDLSEEALAALIKSERRVMHEENLSK